MDRKQEFLSVLQRNTEPDYKTYIIQWLDLLNDQDQMANLYSIIKTLIEDQEAKTA